MTLYALPYSASLLLSWQIVGSLKVGDVVDYAALAVILAGVFIVARYKAALQAAESSAKSWREERDAMESHSIRLDRELMETRAKNAVLEARPDLSELHGQMKTLTEAVADLGQVMRQAIQEG